MATSGDRRRGGALLVGYFSLTFGWTWTLWAAASTRLPEAVVSMLFITGGLGPLLGAAWVVRRGDRSYRRAFLRRIWDPRDVAATWWVALVAIAAGPALLGAAVAWLMGIEASVPAYRWEAVGAVILFALAAGLVEEPGWRGAASDVLQVATRPVWAAIGIGLLWALWHVPLYFIEGSYQHGLGFGSVRFWLFSLTVVELGVIYVWLTNGSGGSILVAVLAHAGFNAVGELVPRSTAGDVTALVVLTVATAAVITATKGRLCFDSTETSVRRVESLPSGGDPS